MRLCIFFCNLSQTTTLVLLFWYKHVTQGQMKWMIWTFGLNLLDAFYAFSSVNCHKRMVWTIGLIPVLTAPRICTHDLR